MARVIAITDDSGKVLGVLRGDPVELADGTTIQAVARSAEGYHHHTLDVPDDLLAILGP